MRQARYASGTVVPPAGLFRMETEPTGTGRYEQFAAECERLAREARTEHHRSVLMEMADAWRKLAEAAARKKK